MSGCPAVCLSVTGGIVYKLLDIPSQLFHNLTALALIVFSEQISAIEI